VGLLQNILCLNPSSRNFDLIGVECDLSNGIKKKLLKQIYFASNGNNLGSNAFVFPQWHNSQKAQESILIIYQSGTNYESFLRKGEVC
jgi:hypothetical protein